jgi:hypothetical protein
MTLRVSPAAAMICLGSASQVRLWVVQEGIERLSAADAERLSRLRIMLAEAQGRIADQSALGQHLAIVGADGVGELAIGICAHKRGVYRPFKPLPVTLTALLEDLSANDAPGAQGFTELHVARNQAQHQGILPAPDQLPRWIDETAALCTFLVLRCFGVELGGVGSAAAVREERLARLLDQAEEAIETGDTTLAFKLSWQAVQGGLAVFRRHTGLGGGSQRATSGRKISDELRNMEDEIASISHQLELSLFASEPGEWMWFEQRHGESANGLEPSVGEARRGFVFALGWVLRMESYVARHGPDRWERWNRHRAPVTGLPGGPHIRDVSRGRPGLPQDEDEWVFQLTDVPDHENPDFSWAIGVGTERSEEVPFTHAYLDRAGKMAVRAPRGVAGKELAEAARRLIVVAKDILEARWAEDAAEGQRREEIASPFRTALSKAELPVKELVVRPADRGVGPLVVWVELADIGARGTSWFGKCLDECFEEHLEEHRRDECRMGFADVLVPADWPAASVVAWMAHARQMANARDKADEDARSAERAAEENLLSEIKAELDGETR